MLIDILFFLVIFLTNIIQGITGFAGTVLAIPIIIALKGINVAKPTLNILGLLASMWILKISYKNINKKEFIKIVLMMLVGVILGNYIYSKVPTEILLKIYAIFIVVIAIKGLFIKKNIPLKEGVLNLVVFLGGIIHGMFVSGGPLIVIYAAQKFKDKTEFRATLSAVWVILNTFMVWTHYSSGLLVSNTMILFIVGLIPFFLGMKIGNKFHYTMDQKVFLKLTYLLLLISGGSLLF